MFIHSYIVIIYILISLVSTYRLSNMKAKRKINESKEEADARRETEKSRSRKRRGIETEEERNIRLADKLVRWIFTVYNLKRTCNFKYYYFVAQRLAEMRKQKKKEINVVRKMRQGKFKFI